MAPTLIALAGPSRSGKGTCAAVLADGAQANSLTVRERQLSGPGKQYVASAFKPEVTEEEAISFFDRLKNNRFGNEVLIWDATGYFDGRDIHAKVPLQQYLQRMLQGARDRWGENFWTDKLIPRGLARGGTQEQKRSITPLWLQSFLVSPVDTDSELAEVADLCLISDLRQVNEAERVKALGGYIIEMQRPPLEHEYVTGSDHVTEQRLSDLRPDLVDYYIEGSAHHNDETFKRLKQDCAFAWREFVRPLILDPD